MLLLRHEVVLEKVKFLVTFVSFLVQLQSQYHVFEVALVAFLQAQLWLVELVTQVNVDTATYVAYWVVLTQHEILPELLRQREVLLKVKFLIILVSFLVQLQS